MLSESTGKKRKRTTCSTPDESTLKTLVSVSEQEHQQQQQQQPTRSTPDVATLKTIVSDAGQQQQQHQKKFKNLNFPSRLMSNSSSGSTYKTCIGSGTNDSAGCSTPVVASPPSLTANASKTTSSMLVSKQVFQIGRCNYVLLICNAYFCNFIKETFPYFKMSKIGFKIRSYFFPEICPNSFFNRRNILCHSNVEPTVFKSLLFLNKFLIMFLLMLRVFYSSLTSFMDGP